MLGVPEKQDFQRCMVKTFLFVTKRKARHGVELWLALSYAFPCCPNHVGLNLKNYNHAHEWSKSFWIHISSSSRVSNLIESPWLGGGKIGICLRCTIAIHLSSKRMSSFGSTAWRCVNWTAGFPCGGRRRSSHAVCFPLQRPQHEQHQSAAPGSSAQPPLPRGAVSITVATVRPVNAGHILVFVSQTYCGNQIKQGRKAVSTNNFGTWGST